MSRNGWALALLSVAFLALVSASALAETDVYASGVVRGKYLYSTEEEASVWDTRVDFDASIGVLTLGAVYRGYWLSDDAYNPADVVVADPNDVKHRYAALEYEDLYLRAGHFSTTFGHGLTLRSYEDVDLEHDTLLDGLFAEYDAGVFDVTALTGASREDSGDRFYAHTVHGARVSVPVGEWMEVAGSAVERSRIWNDEDGEFGGDFARFEDGVRGAEVSGWIGPFTFGGEYAERSGDYPEAAKKVDPETGGLEYPRRQVETQGHATYASGTLDLGWATLFGEFKDFDDFAHSLVNPPTCVREHLWTLMNRATYEVDLNDERGFLVEGSSALGDALFVTGGASEARSHDRDLRHWEMFGHATYDLGSDITLGAAASRSREYLFGEEGGIGKFTEHTTGVVEADLTFARPWILKMTTWHRSRGIRGWISFRGWRISRSRASTRRRPPIGRSGRTGSCSPSGSRLPTTSRRRSPAAPSGGARSARAVSVATSLSSRASDSDSRSFSRRNGC